MTEDFEKFKIKTYGFWDLYLHINQSPYLGRAYAWARRENADHLSDMNKEERDELFEKVFPAWETAVKSLFQHDRSNLAILGNEAPHLHAHFIPRYSTPRIYKGIEFADPNPKGNYAPYEKKKLDLELLLEIKDKLKERI